MYLTGLTLGFRYTGCTKQWLNRRFGWQFKRSSEINVLLLSNWTIIEPVVEDLPLVRFLRIPVWHEYDTYPDASSPKQLLNEYLFLVYWLEKTLNFQILSSFFIEVATTTFQYLVSLVLCDKFQTDQQTMDSEMKTQN